MEADGSVQLQKFLLPEVRTPEDNCAGKILQAADSSCKVEGQGVTVPSRCNPAAIYGDYSRWHSTSDADGDDRMYLLTMFSYLAQWWAAGG
jgi:hypothetical protein